MGVIILLDTISSRYFHYLSKNEPSANYTLTYPIIIANETQRQRVKHTIRIKGKILSFRFYACSKLKIKAAWHISNKKLIAKSQVIQPHNI